MFKLSRAYFSVILAALLPTLAHADTPMPRLSASALQYASIKNIVASLPTEHKVSEKAQYHVQQLKLAHLKLLMQLKNALAKQTTGNDLVLDKKFDAVIQTQQTELSLTELSRAPSGINFLDLQLSDAITLISALVDSVQSTSQILTEMQDLAIATVSGTMSDGERKVISDEFNELKNLMNFVQSVHLANGTKILNGGDLIIRIGDNNDASREMIVPVPRFDAASLSILNLSINTQAAAEVALDTIQNVAMKKINKVFESLDPSVQDDVEAMLLSIPIMLNQDYALLQSGLDDAMQSANGVYSNEDRDYINSVFTRLKQTMNKIQIYPSLDGAKMLGGGSIHIQIGNEASPERVLDIKLPITDEKMLGLEGYQLTTQEGAYSALDKLNETIRDFVYQGALS